MATRKQAPSDLDISARDLAVAYYRVSTAEQAGNGHHSLEVQQDKARREAGTRGLTIVREFTDVASGTKANRNEYQRDGMSQERPG